MNVILTEQQFKEYIKHLVTEQKMHELIMEAISASLTQNEMPKDFKQMNQYMFGDKSKEELDRIHHDFTEHGFSYNNDADHPEKGKHKADITPEVKGNVFPFGNVKLSNQVLIINMTSALRCPSAKYCPISKDVCYAFNDERRRENYWNRNARNEIMFDMARENPAKWPYIFWFIRRYIETARDNGLNVKYVRLNEAGDFKTPEDILRFDKFAGELKKDYGIITHAYTCNVDLVDAIRRVKNMNINASHPDITGAKVLRHFYGVKEEILDKLPDTPLKNIATPILQEDEKWGAYYKCPCDIAEGSKCYNCQVCWLAKPGVTQDGRKIPQFNVLCAIHGAKKKAFKQYRADKKRKMSPEKQKENIERMAKVARRAEKNQNKKA